MKGRKILLTREGSAYFSAPYLSANLLHATRSNVWLVGQRPSLPKPQLLKLALSQHCGAIETRRVSALARRPLCDTDLYSAIVASNGEFLGTSPRLRVGF